MPRRVKSKNNFVVVLIIFFFIAFLLYFFRKYIMRNAENFEIKNYEPFFDEIKNLDTKTLESIYNYIFANSLVLKKTDANVLSGIKESNLKGSTDFDKILDSIQKYFQSYFTFMVELDSGKSTSDKFPVQRASSLRMMCNDQREIENFYNAFKMEFPNKSDDKFKNKASDNLKNMFGAANLGESTIEDIYICLKLLKNTLSGTNNPNAGFFANLDLSTLGLPEV